jgi:hypothetical protein
MDKRARWGVPQMVWASGVPFKLKGTPCSRRCRASLKTPEETSYPAGSGNPAKRVRAWARSGPHATHLLLPRSDCDRAMNFMLQLYRDPADGQAKDGFCPLCRMMPDTIWPLFVGGRRPAAQCSAVTFATASLSCTNATDEPTAATRLRPVRMQISLKLQGDTGLPSEDTVD